MLQIKGIRRVYDIKGISMQELEEIQQLQREAITTHYLFARNWMKMELAQLFADDIYHFGKS